MVVGGWVSCLTGLLSWHLLLFCDCWFWRTVVAFYWFGFGYVVCMDACWFWICICCLITLIVGFDLRLWCWVYCWLCSWLAMLIA